jgi:hypothetical protein
MSSIQQKLETMELTLDERFTCVDSTILCHLKTIKDTTFTTPLRSVASHLDDVDSYDILGEEDELSAELGEEDELSAEHVQHSQWTSHTQKVAPVTPIVTPYGTPFFSNRGAKGAPPTTGCYPLFLSLQQTSGGMSRTLPGTALSLHELDSTGAVHWMTATKGPYLGACQKR